jgi:putative transcriptional regulator
VKPVEEITTGTFLVASPLLQDPNFVRTVVLMCEHSDEGSWGLVVNRRTDLTYGELLDDLPFPAASEGAVFWGGPCEPSRMQVLHRLRRELPHEMEICREIRLGIDADTFRDVVAHSLLPGEALHAYVGHAGWGAGQLAAELELGSWITCSAEPDIVFDTPPDEIWDSVLKSLGSPYSRLTSMPVDPRVN